MKWLGQWAIRIYIYFFFCGAEAQLGPWPPHSWGFLITHNNASRSVGLLRTGDQLVAETSTWQGTTLTTDKLPFPGGIRTHDLSKRTATFLRLRPRGYCDRRIYILGNIYLFLPDVIPYNTKYNNLIKNYL